ncbi:unnamed protein product [Dracunculus medinensis]|uniref:Homeobox domain-containing protein n=1 Tax=Dracunculus medinensis TaxID=318479 RepID=A0A158Q3W9_DRAME|nr:unnamed protein product [Dracunculus medinensis]
MVGSLLGKLNINLPSTSSQSCDNEENDNDDDAFDFIDNATTTSSFSDPLRPYKCDLCKESFEQKHTLLIHYNSVNHLHQAKKILEQQPNNFHSNAQVIAALQASTSNAIQQQQPSLSLSSSNNNYSQGKPFKFAQGEIDPLKPILEQPGGPIQKTIADMLNRDDNQLDNQDGNEQQQQSALAMINILNMAQFLSMTSVGQLTTSTTNSIINQQSNAFANLANVFPNTNSLTTLNTFGDEPQLCLEDERTPRSGIAFRKMLENYGFDVVMQYNEYTEQRKRKLDSLPDDAVPELCRAECSKCNKSFSSIWVLKAHYEEMHKSGMLADEVEKFAVKLRKALDNIDEKENMNEECEASRKRSRQESRTDDDESSVKSSHEKFRPEAKKLKEETRSISAGSTPRPSTSKDNPDLNSQIAMMGMLGFPFIANPFMPVINPDFFTNPLFAAQQNSANLSHVLPCNSPAKRARTRITDEQLKILRQYFDINNSPSEQQIKEMSIKAQLPEKERQRDKDSPYNFSIPPQMSIDLDTYEKTGEAKITSIKAVEASTKNEEIKSATPTATNLKMDNATNSIATSNSASGRRANRTRFTDYQLRTLQQFFDKQAYPKDDDLEILSKKLQLSPRVIVVWFQNARQKARKIYENQPAITNDDRFMKTPGSNFQCKRCQLVFQRYYELIQHQQKLCYKGDCIAQQKDNKAVEENLSEDEKNIFESESRDLSFGSLSANSQTNLGALAQLIGTASTETGTDISQTEFFKLLTKPHDAATLKLKVREKKKAFYKRCPFCCLLFHSRDSLINHIPSRHHEQANSTPVDVDLLPDAEDVCSALRTNQRNSPTNSKRYRTHLTPMQVHVMKSVFTDYKTPSMTECDTLGSDIGLHKRVVQVWFQNARAKERKTRAFNGEDEMHRNSTNQCKLCGVDYNHRLTLHDHIFTSDHLDKVKRLLRTDISSDINRENAPISENNIEKEENQRTRIKAVRDRKINKPTSSQNSHNASLVPSQFPYNLVYGLQPGLAPIMYDPNLMGTPIPLLQIPESVMAQITADISAGNDSTKFTQDGKTFQQLVAILPFRDFQCAASKDSEVGWACPQCTNVFQQELLLKNHQRLICQNCDSIFKLIQSHYECRACNTKLGTQVEFKLHCESAEHQKAREIFLGGLP